MPLEINQAVEHLQHLDLFEIRGRDNDQRKVLRIVGKYFPAKIVSVESVKKYLEEYIFPELEEEPFSIVYFNAHVEKKENFLGISALKSITDAIPIKVRNNLQAVYFVHPGLHSRLFLATFGRFIFTGGLYGKFKYISRLNYLREHVKPNQIEIPEFVKDHDHHLEFRPTIEYYYLESDQPRPRCATMQFDSAFDPYAMRCIA